MKSVGIIRGQSSPSRSIVGRARSRHGLMVLAALVTVVGLLVLGRDRVQVGLRKATGKAKDAWPGRRDELSLELEDRDMTLGRAPDEVDRFLWGLEGGARQEEAQGEVGRPSRVPRGGDGGQVQAEERRV